MPMRLKSDLYKKEQEEVIEKIISILDLTNKNTYTLYELDKNEEIQNKIMELIPEIRKWFSFNGLKAVGEPSKIKRPGKCDLIYCVDDDNKEANKFRYSQDQRRKETKKKKYSKIQLELKKEKINGKTIIEWETELSKLNRKSLNISKFKEYIQK